MTVENGKTERPTVIVIGGGFAGLTAVKALKYAPVKIILLDKSNHHLFQPLLYQVATSAISPADIAVPLRAILRNQKNVTVYLGEVLRIDRDNKTVFTGDRAFSYDYLVVATGASHSYFGNDKWEPHAPGLKTLKDALTIREKVLLTFEKAELMTDEREIQKYLTFVIVGAGPTGVEMAGAISEIARRTVNKEFRNIDTRKTRILLVEAADRVLLAYPKSLSVKAKKSLESLGVEVKLNCMVTKITAEGLMVGEEWIETPNVIWAAGNKAAAVLKALSAPQDKIGRVEVDQYLNIPGSKEVFVVGDSAFAKTKKGKPLPGIAPVAIQQGKYVGRRIHALATGRETRPFRYKDRGIMATIGRARAVAVLYNLPFSGFLAWLLWTFVHIMFLIDFRNKVLVMIEWAWGFFTYNRAVRLITDRYYAQKKLQQYEEEHASKHT